MELNLQSILGNLALDTEQETIAGLTECPTEQPVKNETGNSPISVVRLDMGQMQAPTVTEQAPLLSYLHQREQQEVTRARDAYRSYQKNIRLAGSMRAEILKGVSEGQPAETLLLQACRIISAMTGDNQFSDQVESNLISVYGHGQQAAGALQMELEQVQDRLHNMQDAFQRETNPDCRKRIQRAIEAHMEQENSLQKLIIGTK